MWFIGINMSGQKIFGQTLTFQDFLPIFPNSATTFPSQIAYIYNWGKNFSFQPITNWAHTWSSLKFC